MTLGRLAAALAALSFVLIPAAPSATQSTVYRIDHVTDGDTVVLRNGQRVRLVQIDTPEVFLRTECYGQQAPATTKRLLPEGTRVRLFPELPPIAWTTSGDCSATSCARATG